MREILARLWCGCCCGGEDKKRGGCRLVARVKWSGRRLVMFGYSYFCRDCTADWGNSWYVVV